MGVDHQKAEAIIRSLELSDPPPSSRVKMLSSSLILPTQ